MSDDLLAAKISHGFDHLDVDGDGRLTRHDHVLMGQAVARSLGHAPGSAQETRIVDAYSAIWRDLHASHLRENRIVDAYVAAWRGLQAVTYLPAALDVITREQFIASTSSLADQPIAARATLGALAEAFLAIADTCGSGTVDPDEFFAFQRGHFPGLTRQEADEAFRHLDCDSDGQLSAEEFISAIIEYWTSTNPRAPGNWWAGNPAFGSTDR